MDAAIIIKNCFIHNWNQRKKVALGQYKNINTVQIRLTHLILLSSVIASDLMGLNLYIFGDLTDFLVAQDWCPLALNMSNGIVWVVSGVGVITFSLFSLSPLNHHHSHLTQWGCSYLFCSEETLPSHWKGPKIAFKVNHVYHN